MEEVHGSPGPEPQQVASGPPPIRTADDLIAALGDAAAGDTIPLLAQEHRVGVPLAKINSSDPPLTGQTKIT